MLAREAVTLDHASAGRFELGLGWGSVASELDAFGIGSTESPVRVARMKESLEVIQALWSGETVDYAGEHVSLRGARQMPKPLGRIPIVIGGTGRRTLELVAAHADWWNLHTGVLDDLDRLDDLRSRAGRARASLQLNLAYVHDGADRAEVAELARRRFGPNVVVGTAPGAGRSSRHPGRPRHRAHLRLVLRLRRPRDAAGVRRAGDPGVPVHLTCRLDGST